MIVKPDCQSQGKGIFLTNELERLPREELSVVQEYISNPYLIDGLKFDMRVYVLVISCDPLTIYVANEGLVRFATQAYEPVTVNSPPKVLNNTFKHLTNYALNKDTAEFRQATDTTDDTGHKRSISSLYKRLREDGHDPEVVHSRIKDLILKTVLSIQHELSHSYRSVQPADSEARMCFELLGFDIMLHSDCTPSLLEVNSAPSFATDSPLDYCIKRQLFVDMFSLLGMSYQRRKAKIAAHQQEKHQRMYGNKQQPTREELKLRQQDETAKQLRELEVKSGIFERIYPFDLEGLKEQLSECLPGSGFYAVLEPEYRRLTQRQQMFTEIMRRTKQAENQTNIRAVLKLEEKRQIKQDKERREEQKKERLKVISEKIYENYKLH